MSSSISLRISLRQHTPLIHFQYNSKKHPNAVRDALQQNATLRATEVKPRLDKFIIEQLAKQSKSIPKHWFVGKEQAEKTFALDYKLLVGTLKAPEIKSIGTFKKDITGSYFGDALGVRWPEDSLILTFTSFETDVLDAIYQHIISFFVLHNFGQRQTKGFGSFTVDKLNNKPIPGYLQTEFGATDMERILRQHHSIVYRLDESAYKKKIEAMMKERQKTIPAIDSLEQIIHSEYQVLKAGRSASAPEGYLKSKLFDFFINSQPRIRWEKRKIKQEINKNIEPDDTESPFHYPLFKKKEKEYDTSNDSQVKTHYVRALLGLAENNEYLVDDEVTTDKNGKPAASKEEKYAISIEHQPADGNKIERMASPILFKVFNRQVYLIPLPQAMNSIFNQTFKFTLYNKLRQSDEKRLLFNLTTPSSFDLLAFLDQSLDMSFWQELN